MYQLRANYEVEVSVSFVDDAGAPAQVDGVPVWMVEDESLFTFAPSADGMGGVLQGTGSPIGGMTRLSVEADADLGVGVVSVKAGEDLQLVSGQATVASFGFGEPRPIPG